MDHCVQAVLTTGRELKDRFGALTDEERKVAAFHMRLVEPRRPWLWPMGAYIENELRPRLIEMMGEDRAEMMLTEHRDVVVIMAACEIDCLKRRARKEDKQDPQTDLRQITTLIVGAAYLEHLWTTGGKGSANSTHVAVADRLGLEDMGVIRRWEKEQFAKRSTRDEREFYVHLAPKLDRLAAIGRAR